MAVTGRRIRRYQSTYREPSYERWPACTTFFNNWGQHILPEDWARELLESFKDTENLVVLIWKDWEVLDLSFCGWRHSQSRFSIFGWRLQALGRNRKGQFLLLKKNQAKIRVCRALDRLSGVCGSEVIAWKQEK